MSSLWGVTPVRVVCVPVDGGGSLTKDGVRPRRTSLRSRTLSRRVRLRDYCQTIRSLCPQEVGSLLGQNLSHVDQVEVATVGSMVSLR